MFLTYFPDRLSRHRCPRSAFTLIEVMVGTVLLSTLVVSGIHGLRLHQRQLRFNEHRIEAVTITERQLKFWENQPEGVPIGGAGVIDVERQWFWRTQLIDARSVFGLPVLIIRFEVVENIPTPGVVLLSVDLMKPAPIVTPSVMTPQNDSPEPEPEEPPT